jgi:hypothetical protein
MLGATSYSTQEEEVWLLKLSWILSYKLEITAVLKEN